MLETEPVPTYCDSGNKAEDDKLHYLRSSLWFYLLVAPKGVGRKSAHRADHMTNEPFSPQFPLPPVPCLPPRLLPGNRGVPWVGREKLACIETQTAATAATAATCTVPSRLFNDSNAWGP